MKYTYEVITNTSCNLECYFCFAKDKSHSKYLSLDDFNKGLKLVLKKMKGGGSQDKELFIKIYGGEPLLQSEKIIEYLESVKEIVDKKIKLSIAIITNGTILHDYFLEYFVKNRYELNLELTFSFEINEEYQDKIRHFKSTNVGSYKKFVENIEKYKKYTGGNPVLQTVISPEFIENIDKYIKFIDDNKDKYRFGLVPMFDSTFDNFDMSKFNNLGRLFDYYEKKVKEKDDDHLNLFQVFRSCVSLSNIGSTYSCSAGTTSFAISPEGFIYPCSRMFHNKQEFLNYGHIDDINVTNAIEERETFMLSQVKLDGDCKKCQTDNEIGCIGQCISEKLLRGDLKQISAICAFNIKFGKLSKKLYDTFTIDEFKKHIRYANVEAYKDSMIKKFFDIEKKESL